MDHGEHDLVNDGESFTERPIKKKPPFQQRLKHFLANCGKENREEAEEIAKQAYSNSKKEAKEIQGQGCLNYLKKTLRKQAVWIVMLIIVIVFHYFGVWVEIWRFLLDI